MTKRTALVTGGAADRDELAALANRAAYDRDRYRDLLREIRETLDNGKWYGLLDGSNENKIVCKIDALLGPEVER
jgi:hypothetical protein